VSGFDHHPQTVSDVRVRKVTSDSVSSLSSVTLIIAFIVVV